MERKFVFSVGEFYHIYNRGNNKALIFLDDFDKKRFIKLLYICNGVNPVIFKTVQGLPLDKIERGKTLVDVGAYCLMSNHFHLLLHEKSDKGVSLFMGKLLTAYSMYFNKKYDRHGTLFEGPFQAKHADDDNYLKYIFSYIHLNPIKIIDPNWKDKGISDYGKSKTYLGKYAYSSYIDYLGVTREERAILNQKAFPEYFENQKDFEESVDTWVLYKDYTE